MRIWTKALVLLGLVVMAVVLMASQKVQTVEYTADPWTPISPLPQYGEWWTKNLACLSAIPALDLLESVPIPTHKARYEDVKWYVAGADFFVNPDGRMVLGQFFPPDTVVLAGMLHQSERLVRHELLHVMGWEYHPMVPFKFPCDVE